MEPLPHSSWKLTVYRSGTKRKGGRHAGHMTPDVWVLHFRPEAQPGFWGLCISSPLCTAIQQLWKVMVIHFLLFKSRCSLNGLSLASVINDHRPLLGKQSTLFLLPHGWRLKIPSGPSWFSWRSSWHFLKSDLEILFWEYFHLIPSWRILLQEVAF
jgi:hypothetical protein